MDKNNPLEPLHTRLLQLQKDIHAFCLEEKLPYFLIGGSLLGAIRHQGFIPWDDDLDIGMDRSIYERFLKAFPNSSLEKKGYYLKVPGVTKNYHATFIKICDPHLHLVEHDGTEVDLFIDIFPFDGIPKSNWQQKLQYYRFYYYFDAVKFRLTPIAYSGAKKIVAKTILLLTKGSSTEKLMVKRDAILTKYNQIDAPGFVNFSSAYGYHKEILTKQEMTELIEVPFEDATFLIPKAYDGFLTRMYGNYMSLPPKEQQTPRHITQIKEVGDKKK